ncbi:MAG: SIS domain-containing protein [Limnobacter sp.]|nr:SIS domain-containing protein [Limnobacter sp.]
MSLLNRLRQSLGTLSPAEQAVARLVLADAAAFQRTSVSELARLAGVSSPTVVRFCRAMGYEGLSDFKLKLAAQLGDGVPFVHQTVKASDSSADLIQKVLDNVIFTLSDYKASVPAKPFEMAVEALCGVIQRQGKLEFYGVGNSGFVALDAQHKFFRMGCSAQAYSDGHLQIMAAAMLDKSDLLVIISNSGRSQDLLDACEIAKKSGATTIAITATGSPLSQLVDIHLPADHDELYEQYSPMVSRVLHLCIVDILVTHVAIKLGNKVQKNMAKLKKNLIERRYSR